MPPSIATAVYVLGIFVLFWLDQDRRIRTSKAIWIPVAWLLIVGSRPVSRWLADTGLGGPAPAFVTPDQYLDGNTIDRNVFAALLVFGVIVLVKRRPTVVRLCRANVPILAFFLYCAASIIWSDYPDVAFKRWIKATGDFVMVLIILTDPDRSAAVRRVLVRVGFVLVPLSLLFIKYYPSLGREYNIWTWTWMSTGVTLGKNTLGMICLIFGLGSVWCIAGAYRERKGTSRNRRLFAHGVFLATVLWLLWISNSMTAISCFALASLLVAVTSRPAVARKPAVTHFVVAAMITISAAPLFFNVGGAVLETMGRNPTLTGRTAIWDVVLRMTTNPLVGTGFEGFWLGERLKRIWTIDEGTFRGIQEAHNGYLEVYANLGWVGVILIGILIATGYRNIMVGFRRDPRANTLSLAYLLIAVIYNFTEAGFRMLYPVWIFFLLAVTVVPKACAPSDARSTLTATVSPDPMCEHYAKSSSLLA